MYTIMAAVSQPPAPSGRKMKLTASPVEELSKQLNITCFTPTSAKDDEFIEQLKKLDIDLCITAAYGQYLPKKFLSIPKFGTVNIHPSLLPKYRGAAPIQRCLENGDSETGVSILFSVAKMDAGPILHQLKIKLTGDEKATELLPYTFDVGSKELIKIMPSIFDKTINLTEQNDGDATLAPKLNSNDGLIDFKNSTARQIHNKCRGYAEWPGIFCFFTTASVDSNVEPSEMIRVKIITTMVINENDHQITAAGFEKEDQTVKYLKTSGGIDLFVVKCKDDSLIGLLELQPAGKKIMSARDYWNGLRGKVLRYTQSNIEVDAA